MNPLELTLGIMTAVGGFVDISELVFAAKAGSIFGYALIWVFVLGTIGMSVFGEMSGRVAAVAKQPVFSLMRHRLGLKLGLITLVGSLVSTLITCAAEVGGMALILNYLTGAPYLLLAVASVIALMASMWVLPFKWIERTYGLLGLIMIVFAVALVAIHPPWGTLAAGFVPQVPRGLSPKELLTFAYFTVAILSAVLFPYESYFYSSGGIEEEWGPKDLLTNRVTCTVGFGLGSLLAISILAGSAQLFGPVNVGPEVPGTSALEAAIPFGRVGLLCALLGMLFAVGGAAVETCMSNAYALAQFFGWEWGRRKKPWGAPRFTLAWIVMFLLALAIVMTGVDVMSLVEYAVLFSIIVLPLTYLPLMLLAGDRSYMGRYANKWLAKALGWPFFVIVTIAALAAIPLYLMTSGGQG
ncbi:NRAMP family divalent metal transporter [Sphingomonas sp.]|uniref:NRAMP family divalent metal transporter n=1 Tax=Sphingomonas sp. TaxID=28214 RepID=UPI0038A89621